MVGFSRSDDDVFSVQDFLTSRDAIAQLGEQLPLREYVSHSGRDSLMSFPTLIYGDTSEEFYKYMQNFIDVNYNTHDRDNHADRAGLSAARRQRDGLDAA